MDLTMNNIKLFYPTLIMILIPISSILSNSFNWKSYVAGGNNINAIAQEDSFLWIGTEIGLVCLNTNNNTKTFYDEITGLPYPAITCIAIDS